MTYVAQRRFEIAGNDAKELEKLLGSVLAVVGSDNEKGTGEDTKEG